MNCKLALLVVTLLPLLTVLSHGADFDREHALLDKVLDTHVKDGLVDYTALKANPTDLNKYLDQLAAVSESEFKGWNEKQQLAFLINLYNATTLRLIIDHYPITSIRKIGSLFSGPWKQPVVRLHGKTTDLDTVEHKILRKQYKEPRIHFALVCAALGCPTLRSEPYMADKLDEQLEDQGRLFLNSPKKNSVNVDKRVLYLSEIFKWFKEDFESKAGSVRKFVAPYFPEPVAAVVKKNEFNIKYTDYDWTLNDLKKASW